MKYFVIRTDNSLEVRVTDQKSISLHDMYPIIGNGCDTVQPAETYGIKKKYTIWLDEDGKCKPNAVNHSATVLYGQAPYDFIVGDVVITRNRSCACFTDAQADQFMAYLRNIFDVEVCE